MKVKILITLLIIGIVISLIQNFYSDNKENYNETKLISFPSNFSKITGENKVLQIDLTSAIFFSGSGLPGGIEFLIKQIDEAAKNSKIRGLFIRANSPGGSTAASQELYEAVKRFQETGKPIITSVMSLCASGCYYAALPSSFIIGNRSSMIGSIGVIMNALNMEELFKKIGIKVNTIASVKYKDILSPTRKMRPEEKSHLKKVVSQMHEDFVSDVVLWRKKHSSEPRLRKAANGLVYTSKQALKIGLIDKVGDQRFAKKEMAKALGLPLEEVTFIKPVYQYWEEIFGFQISSFWNTLLPLIGKWGSIGTQNIESLMFNY